MLNQYYKLIKDLRIKKGLKQEYLAEKIGVSRASYIAFEQGKTELNFSQVAKLADIFGISLEEVEKGVEPKYEKYKEMILAYLRLVGNGGKIPKTKLAKLLYLADFAWFYEKFESMSGMQYRRLPYGPVPDIYFRAVDELEMSGKIVVDRSRDNMLLIKESESNHGQKFNLLNNDEKKLIKEINKKWQDKKTEEIVNFTHNQMPYFLCRENEIIPYELITQEDADSLY